MLPGDFAPWKSVYYYFCVWKKNEIFEIIQTLLQRQVIDFQLVIKSRKNAIFYKSLY